MKKKVLVLDFGSQYTQLIARRVRELEVYSEIVPCSYSTAEIDVSEVGALILSGGPASVSSEQAPEFDEKWLTTGVPTLGVCYGMQLISHLSGARLSSGARREYGRATLEILDDQDLFKGFSKGEKITVWMSHGDHVEQLPKGFRVLASSEDIPFASIGCAKKRMYAVQFHPEVVHTPRGIEVLRNFLFDIAGLARNWSPGDLIASKISEIGAKFNNDNRVICGLSGGVDSSVAAVLVNKAVGEKLVCIFVDNGLLRHNEARQVVKRLGSEGLGLNLKLVNASERFLEELKGATDPEQKRKIIGRVFIEVFEEEAKRIPNVTHLVQGTLYPDVIESVSVRGPSATIKSHHNVGGLPEKMNLELIEPFRDLFKDEVRRIGKELSLPDEIIQRQPFPGPGLAVRIVSDITKERLEILRRADKIFLEEIRAAGLYRQIWQSFAVLLPVSSVGVMGDSRTYEQVITLRAVYSEDGMTADWVDLPRELLQRTSNRIINEVSGINRVVYDISSKPPATIEWE